MNFKVGQRVKWTSSSGGVRATTKMGVVRWVVPAGEGALTQPTRADALGRYNTKTLGGGMPRPHASYLIEVPPPLGSSARPRLYWPVVSLLRPA